MPTEDRKYVRVYYNDLIRDYPEVWADNDLLATWLRLLSTADPMWPTPPEVPRSAKPSHLSKLVTSTLVEESMGRFRMKGLDAERTSRQDAARNAAAKRWHSEGIAPTDASPMPKRIRAEQTKDEPSNARESLPGDDGRADLEAFLLITRRAPTVRQRQLLDGLLQLHDLTGPQWAADIMLRHPDDPIGAVIAADKEWRRERIAAAQAQEVPKVIPRRRPSGLTGINAELAALFRDQEANRDVEDGAA